MADTATDMVIPSANQLIIKDKRLQIRLPEDFQVEAMLGKGSEICKFLQIYFFRLVVQFSEKLKEALYIGWHLYRNRNNFQNGA